MLVIINWLLLVVGVLVTLYVSVIMFFFYCLLAMFILLCSRSNVSSILCRAGLLVDMNSISLFVLWKVSISPSTMADSFVGYSS